MGEPTQQNFSGLNSSPFVFIDPYLMTRPQLTGTRFTSKDNSVAGLSNPQSSSGLTPCPQNAHCNDNSLPEEASSVSAPSEDSLRNTLNMDCGALTSSGKISQSVGSQLDSPISGLKLNNQVDKGKDVIATGASPLISDKDHKGNDEMTTSASPLVNVKDVKGKDEMTTGTTPLVNDKDDKVKDDIATGASPLMSEQAQEMHQFKPLSDFKPAEVDEKLGAGNVPPEQCLDVEPNSSNGCAFNNQCGGYSAAETGENSKEAELGCTSQLGSRLNVEEQDHHSGHTDVQCTEAGQKTVQQDHILEQRGVRRRCLQFEDAQGETIGKGISAHNLSGIAGFPSSSSSPEVLEVLESSSRDEPAIPGTGLLANVYEPTFSSQDSGNYTTKVPKPSGIGLHLNSIVNAMQIGSGATVSLKSAERGSLSILGKRSSSTMSCHLSKNSLISLNRAEVDSVSNEDSKHDNTASIARSSNPSLSDMVKHMNDCSLFKPIELQPHLYDKRKSISENADNTDDSSPCSPKKKRKKTLDADDNNGCKRCNCKKTKCLKLYCDCFAAGIYCADPCACQGCLNRPEYEDTVIEIRQQIESRNPLAFAPKIIQNITEPSARSSGDDGIRYTPASARHKRGCNCKKSKCLKKYCECYQSGVGCCDGCRCEGCGNMYGQKGDYSMIKNLVSKHNNDKIPDGPYDKKLESVVTRDSLALNELCNPHNLTPLTPSIQCSNHGKTASKSLFSSESYITSPESGLNFLAPYGTTTGSALNPDNQHVITETNNEIMDLVSFDQSLEYGSGDMVNHFSPGFDSPTLPNPQLRIQMLPGNPQVSPASSFCWRTSPINLETHFEGTKFLEVTNFDGRLHGMINDDTPEILKETPIPLHTVKVSSPNKKRVSPPHGHGTAIGSSSSAAGMRSGRKFILQAVSAFPPLTPCMDSKVHSGQNIKDSKDYSRR